MKPSVAIIGVGLMGASLAAALRAVDFASCIVGIDENPESLALAVEQGWLDRGVAELGPHEADIVVLATPVGAMPGLLARLQPLLSARAVITDMGSVKGPVAQAAETLGLARFVPGHPIAGAERSGPAAASAALFVKRVVVLTPREGCDLEAVAVVRAMWEAAGAHVLIAEPGVHDRMVAYTSHLPHLLAFACADLLAEEAEDHDLYPFVGAGLRDFLRIAGSDPVMWRDVCQANAALLGPVLAAYGERLAAYGRALAAGDFVSLQTQFAKARDFRETLIRETDRGEH